MTNTGDVHSSFNSIKVQLKGFLSSKGPNPGTGFQFH